MYVIIGWLNVCLLLVMTAPFWLRVLNTHFLHLKGGLYAKSIKLLRKIHKPLGLTIMALALIHGYLALGSLRLHTGVLVWLAIAITACLGLSYFLLKKKALLIWHRRMALVIAALVLLHLLFPGAVYYLLQ